MRKLLWLGLLVVVAAVCIWWLGTPADRETGDAPLPAVAANSDPVARGRELTQLADCQSCHTARGGTAFAGGRPIPTPFGTFYTPNITPDTEAGLGSWSATDFWHALHNGYSRDGTLLYPTFPYTNYTRISRPDSDAIYAYLRTIPPAGRVNRRHQLKFPYNYRILLAAWRWLYFRPGVYQTDSGQDAQWNRGSYLVQGLAHCSACHETRNALGGTRAKAGPSGGLVLDWYAPSLTSPHEAGLQSWSTADIVTLLKTGRVSTSSASASTAGPMAEVVAGSLQYAREDELQAMAVYLKSLPSSEQAGKADETPAKYDLPIAIRELGKNLYEKNCADCHGRQGEGHEPEAPRLAGNRAVTLPLAVNSIRMILFGGYAPGTAGNPRPFGMPPYSLVLSDEEIAEILDYVRTSWGNRAPLVFGEDVGANRGNPLW